MTEKASYTYTYTYMSRVCTFTYMSTFIRVLYTNSIQKGGPQQVEEVEGPHPLHPVIGFQVNGQRLWRGADIGKHLKKQCCRVVGIIYID